MKARPLVLTVDTNRRNQEVLQACLAKHGYSSLPVASSAEFDQALANAANIGLALVDIGGFDDGIWYRCDQLTRLGIPFLLLTAQSTAAVRQASLRHGARGLYVKPLAMLELVGAIRTLLP